MKSPDAGPGRPTRTPVYPGLPALPILKRSRRSVRIDPCSPSLTRSGERSRRPINRCRRAPIPGTSFLGSARSRRGLPRGNHPMLPWTRRCRPRPRRSLRTTSRHRGRTSKPFRPSAASEAIADDVPDQAGTRKDSELRAVGRTASDGGESLCPAYSESANRAGMLPPLAMRPLTWDSSDASEIQESRSSSSTSSSEAFDPEPDGSSLSERGGFTVSSDDDSVDMTPSGNMFSGLTEGASTEPISATEEVSTGAFDAGNLSVHSATLSSSFHDLSRVNMGADVSSTNFFTGSDAFVPDGGAAGDWGAGSGAHSAAPSLDSSRGVSAASRPDQDDGPEIDLSQTNDLLQQILDEVRKGRTSFLPTHDRNSEYLQQSR